MVGVILHISWCYVDCILNKNYKSETLLFVIEITRQKSSSTEKIQPMTRQYAIVSDLFLLKHGPVQYGLIKRLWDLTDSRNKCLTHIGLGNLTVIGSDNGLSPGRRQAIIWTNDGILLIRPIGTNFSETLVGIHTFSFKEMHLKMSSAKWRPFCLGSNMLRNWLQQCSREVCQIYKWSVNAKLWPSGFNISRDSSSAVVTCTKSGSLFFEPEKYAFAWKLDTPVSMAMIGLNAYDNLLQIRN